MTPPEGVGTGASLAAPAPPFAARNFAALVGDIACFFIGIAFLDAATTLPALVERLGGSATFLGVLLALRRGAYYLPPLLVAHHLRNRTRYKPYLLAFSGAGRIWLWPAALAMFLFGTRAPAVALAALAFAYIVAELGDGAGGVPWTAIVGRAIPSFQRGRLFATSQVISAIARLGVAALVVALLGERFVRFPANASLLVGGCALFLTISWSSLTLLREPSAPVEQAAPDALESEGFGTYLRGLPARLRARPDFARLAVGQVLWTSAPASVSFLIGYANGITLPRNLPPALDHVMALLQTGGLPGLFLLVQTLALILFAPLWGAITDRYGPKTALVGVVALSLGMPVMGLLTGGTHLAVFLCAYFVFGATQDAWVTFTNYLLEAVPPSEQATYIALMSASSLPALILPVICGLLVSAGGVRFALGFAALLLAAGLWAVVGLPPTRTVAGVPRNSVQ